MFGRLRARWRALLDRLHILNSDRFEDAMADEMRFHLGARVADLASSGMPRDQAERQARLEFGGVERAKEECRQTRSARALDEIRRDFGFAVRMFLRNKTFTLTAVCALALGIGATTAVFSVVKTVLLDPLPYRDADRIVQLLIVTVASGRAPNASVPKFAVWRDQTSVFEDVAGYNPRAPGVNLTGEGDPYPIRSVPVTAEFFRLFSVPVVQGRTFSAEEDRPNGPLVVVISHGLWMRRYGGDPGIVGRVIQIAGQPRTVVGIVGPTFVMDPFPRADVWVPCQFDLDSSDQAHFFSVAGRLKPGVSLEMASAQLKVAEGQFRRKFPIGMGPREGFSVEPLQDTIVGNVRLSLLVLVGAVGLVMLIACSNVANLLLFRATGRQREIAVRAAIGAGRNRIVRQLLAETIALFVAGGTIGVGLGFAALRLLLTINPGNIPRIGDFGQNVAIDSRVLAFAFAVSFVAAIISGLVPALGSSRPDLVTTLKEGGGRTGSVTGQKRARALLVVSEVSIAVVLLIGAALLIRTFVALRHVNPGFKTRNVLTLQMSLTGDRFAKTADVTRLVRQGVEQVKAVPGVDVAAFANVLPPENRFLMPFSSTRRPPIDGTPLPMVGWSSVSSEFFDALSIPLRRGRSFSRNDDALSAPVAIVNEALARQLSQDGDPLDQTVLYRGAQFPDAARRIVGVVGDIRDEALNREPRPILFVPDAQVPDSMTAWNSQRRPFYWFVRTKENPHALSAAIQEALGQASGRLPVGLVRTMDEVMSKSTATEQFSVLLVATFAGAALLLAAIGIYGLLAYSVEQRTQEIAIRMCLGAQAGQVRRLVMRQGLQLTFIGLALGVAAALGLARLLTNLLYGVEPWDPLVFVAVPLVLTVVALAAVWIPSLRASRLNPVLAIRE